MRLAHATTANESPASATEAVEPAQNAEPAAKHARRHKQKVTSKALKKPTKVRVKRATRTPDWNKPRPRGETAAKVAKLLAKGMEPPAIAKRLGLSDVTVYYHRQRLNDQRSESRDIVPAKARAIVPTTEATTVEVLDDAATVVQPRVTSLGLGLVLEAKKDAYAECWAEQRELTRAERKILDAIDAFMGR